MSIILLTAMLFGAGAPLIARRRPILWAAMVVLLPPILIAAYYLRDLIEEDWARMGFGVMGAAWIGGSAIGAGIGLAIRARRTRG